MVVIDVPIWVSIKFMISQHDFDSPLKSDDYQAISLRQDNCIPKMNNQENIKNRKLWRKDTTIDMEQPIIFYILYLKFFGFQ